MALFDAKVDAVRLAVENSSTSIPPPNGISAVAAGTALATGGTITDQRAVIEIEQHVVGVDATAVGDSAATRAAGAARRPGCR